MGLNYLSGWKTLYHPKSCYFPPNNKQWVTPDLKALLNRKKMAFCSEDIKEIKAVHWERRYTGRRCKKAYKERLEKHLEKRNARKAWRIK